MRSASEAPLLLSLLLAPPAEALITVCPSSCDETDATVAILNAPPGETIQLGDGVWPLNVTIDKDLTVRGQNPGMAVISVGGAEAAFVVDAIVGFVLEDVSFESDSGGILTATQSASVTLRGITAHDQSPDLQGSLIEMVAGGTLDLRDSSFTGYMHSSGNNGAVLWLGGGGTATVTNVVIEGAHAIDGGAIFANDTTLTLDDVDISGCSAVIDGGAVYVNYTATVYVNDSTFDQNQAGLVGGHIKSSGSLFVDGSSFSNGLGGQLYVANAGALYAPIEVTDSTFVNNATTGNGGAINGFDMVISGCTFDGNTASESGGAIRTEGAWAGTTTISDSLFLGNQSGTSGGAVYVGWSQPASLLDSQFVGNTAYYGPGGAVSIQGQSAELVQNCYFSGNDSIYGHAGALEIGYNQTLSRVVDCTFEDNGALGGGAIMVLGSLVEVEGCAFCNNHATSEAGAIGSRDDGSYAQGLAVTNSVFARNVSAGGAGAVHTREDFGPTTLLNNDFLDNTGGLYWGSAVTLYMNTEVDVRNNLFAWNRGAQSPLWAQQTLGSLTADYNLYFDNDGNLAASYDPVTGANDLGGDPMLTDYTYGMPCGTWDLTPLPNSPLIDAGDPSITDPGGGPSDVGVTGGPGADDDPGWNGTSTGTGTGTGTGSPTGTGSGTGTGTGTASTDADGDGYPPPFDCDDSDPEVHPGAKEVANDDKDNDCDGQLTSAWLGGRACDQGGGGGSVLGLLAAIGLLRRRYSSPTR